MTAFLMMLTLLAASLYVLAAGSRQPGRNTPDPAPGDRHAYWRRIRGRQHTFTSQMRR